MPFVKTHIHFVWSTKNREPLLFSTEFRKQVWQHIREHARSKEIFIEHINGFKDHCHCLISLGTDQTLQKTVQLIKGESSFWINQHPEFQQSLRGRKFAWQNDYFAVSVSESMLDRLSSYIKHQEDHHRHKTFQEEYEEFIQRYNFQKLKRK
jgi:putative transposase